MPNEENICQVCQKPTSNARLKVLDYVCSTVCMWKREEVRKAIYQILIKYYIPTSRG